MSDDDLFAQQIKSDRLLLMKAAPDPDFVRLWNVVRETRASRLKHWLAIISSIPAILLILAGLGMLLSGDGWHMALPCVGLSFWMLLQFPGATRPMNSAAGRAA